MNSVKLARFVAVAEKLSFRGAARDLNVAQPALSRTIAEIEAHFGTELFLRVGRKIALTPAGEVLLREGQIALAKLRRAEELTFDAAAGEAGKIAIGYGVFASMGPMSDVVLEFNRRVPGASVRLVTLATTEQLEQIEMGHLDAGFVFSIACKAPFTSRLVSQEDYVLLAPAGHPLARHTAVSLSDLTACDFVLGNTRRWGPYRAMVDALCADAGFLPNVVEEAEDLPILMLLLKSGVGVSLHGAAIKHSLPPGVTAVPIAGTDRTIDISLAWKADSMHPVLESFVAVLESMLANGPIRIGL